MTVADLDNRLQAIQRDVEQLIMAGKLAEDITTTLDMWETLGDIDSLLREWDADPRGTQRRLINEQMMEDDQ